MQEISPKINSCMENLNNNKKHSCSLRNPHLSPYPRNFLMVRSLRTLFFCSRGCPFQLSVSTVVHNVNFVIADENNFYFVNESSEIKTVLTRITASQTVKFGESPLGSNTNTGSSGWGCTHQSLPSGSNTALQGGTLASREGRLVTSF